jgi:hypothetical protein
MIIRTYYQSLGAAKKAVEAKLEEITAGKDNIEDDADAAANLTKKEEAARIGWAIIDLTASNSTEHPDALMLSFGTWNDRNVNQAQARKIADTMRGGVKRYQVGNEIKIPVDVADLTPAGLAKLRATKNMSLGNLLDAANGGSLPKLADALKQTVRRVHPAGGQHRQRGLELHLAECRKEMNEAAKTLVELGEKLKDPQASPEALASTKAQINATTARAALLKLEVAKGGSWLVSVFDRCKCSRFGAFDRLLMLGASVWSQPS